jgi:hypothetical protein
MVRLMDKLERRLKDDARLIEAELTADLQARMRASLEATVPQRRTPRTKGTPGIWLWWASSLTGLAAAALVIVFLNFSRRSEIPEQSPPPPLQEYAWSIHEGFPLQAETTDWTGPLETELKNLQSDLEKARASVEHDLRASF